MTKHKVETMKKVYYSDIISKQQVNEWYKNNEIVVLSGGMGTGKSQFVFNSVLEQAIMRNDVDTIYILSNRAKLKQQLKQRYNVTMQKLEKYGLYYFYLSFGKIHISVSTYQSFEKFSKSISELKEDFELGWIDSRRTIIICDEFHYFLGDSWNRTTENCLDLIMEYKCNTYLLSATGEETMNYINKYTNRRIQKESVIELPTDYSHIVLNSYSEQTAHNTEKAQEIIKNILDTNNSAKVLYFLNNVKQLESIKTKLNEEYGDIAQVSKSGSNDVLDAEGKLLKRVTLTTSTLDNGIDIMDDDLQIVIIDLLDLFSIVQAIGRKRTTTPTTVYIKEHSTQELNGHINNIEQSTPTVRKKADMTTRIYYNNLRHTWLNLYKQSGVVATVYDRLKKTNIKYQRQIDLKSLKDYLRRCRTKGIEVDMIKLKQHLSNFGINVNENTYINTINSHLNSLKIHEKFTQKTTRNNKKYLILE